MRNLSSDSPGSSRDLLQRFMVASVGDALEAAKDDTEIELNLGLSLGGRFGVDRSSKNLGRSSSVASFLPSVRDDPQTEAAAAAGNRIARTSSLPVETEEEWRKRKELQSLRRMQAKRRMSEKQRISLGDKGISAAAEDEKNFEKERCAAAPKLFGLSLGFQAWEAAGQKGKGGDFSKALQPSPQGSIESQGGSSSSMSEFESKSLQGSCEHSPTSYQSTQDMHKKDVGTSGVKTIIVGSRMAGTEMESTSDKAVCTSEKARNPGMDEMPCVFTKGDGPNGRRVDGILYKYGKGQEVRIMCVCHGSFLSPAEFVKHAGGADVAHPLKHIVVNPNASSSSPFP
ncbi:hypothetical protein DM860_000292 [Cuscuta australis]|uniref:Ninja-family protein n=1 Tax=Cuscuta australis TaxID=267555 RepID=A0A328CYS5_9ASTE|nr:hypothetical protein DM860_000292 [Cuscuta australis]